MKEKEIRELFEEICKNLKIPIPQVDLPSYEKMVNVFQKMCPYHHFDDGCERSSLEEGFIWGYLTNLALNTR